MKRFAPPTLYLFFKVEIDVQVAQHGITLVTSAKVTSKKRDRDFNSRHCRAHVKVTLLVM